MRSIPFPRLVVAGLSGDAGKTLVSLGLVLAAKRAGLPVRAFKKGPDYIDAGWLTWASGHPARNLDTFLMGFPRAADSFTRNACPEGLNVIEGNRGLYDGSDRQGTHSTAELAKALRSPVVLVVDATKATRTVAACVLGCQHLDPQMKLAGVILNRVGGARHRDVVRAAIEADCGVPVLGSIPRIAGDGLLPARHLGLVTPDEHPATTSLSSRLLTRVGDHLDLVRLLLLAREAPPLPPGVDRFLPGRHAEPVTVGYVRDSAFSFYYPENLEALEAAGARLLPISSLADGDLPNELDALYLGGGFPETHARAISNNRGFLSALKARARAGLPVYAECGGLMLLCRALLTGGTAFPMAGILPFDVEVCSEPQGHGYAQLRVDGANPFFPVGTEIRGHEFHYSKIVLDGQIPNTACAVHRGCGCFESRDGVVAGNVWASYIHVHALGTPNWAGAVLSAARTYARSRNVLESIGVQE